MYIWAMGVRGRETPGSFRAFQRLPETFRAIRRGGLQRCMGPSIVMMTNARTLMAVSVRVSPQQEAVAAQQPFGPAMMFDP
ncbi:MAG: hypothetical protein EB020_12395 [Proteobacteria bacterium]|nr:hypothetical protein [Pseudomonadota bacterium]NDF97288.1 hypothetical protein [Pseudomonadota bacterium]